MNIIENSKDSPAVNAQLTESDRIITLSTCMNDKSKRFLVSGVLVYDSAEN